MDGCTVTLVLFPDTNLFLQCRDLSEIDWASVLDAAEITLVVSRTVQNEIDNFKSDGNGRRSKRARRASGVFRAALKAPHTTLEIRHTQPRVALVLARAPASNRAKVESLDLTLPDHRLVDEALHYVRQFPAADVRVLSHDTGVLLCARDHSLNWVEVPDDWLLDPENDEKDKKIRALTERIRLLEQEEPKLSMAVLYEAKPITALALQTSVFDAPSEIDLQRIEQEVIAAYPEVKDFTNQHRGPRGRLYISTALDGEWQPPAQSAVDEYAQAYANWRASIRTRVESLHRQLNAAARIVCLRFVLRNEGSRPAERVLIESATHDSLRFTIGEDESSSKLVQQLHNLPTGIELDPPPGAPQGRYVSILDRLAPSFSLASGMSNIREWESRSPSIPNMRPFNRDRNAFYLKDGARDSFVSESVLECEEFRHARGETEFELTLFVPAGTDLPSSRLHFRVSASNVREPVEMYLPISFSYQSKKADQLRKWRVRRDKKSQ
jgi:hypothetical protein